MRDPELVEQLGAAERDDFAMNLADHAEAVRFPDVVDRHYIAALSQQGERAADRVAAGGGEACRERGELGAIDARLGLRFHELQLADRDGAGLVEDHRIDGGEIFQEGGALHQNAVAARDRDRGDRGCGRGEHQRAGAGGDQHREHRHRIAGHEPGAGRDQQHQHHVAFGIALEQPGDRRLGALGVLQQRDDPAEGRFGADARELHEQMAVDIDRAAQHLDAGAPRPEPIRR